jgi:hypothetical protein
MAEYIVTGTAAVDQPPVDAECTICFENLSVPDNTSDTVRLDPCRHMFHRECIQTWFQTRLLKTDLSNSQKKLTCPNCRAELFTANGITTREVVLICKGFDLMGYSSSSKFFDVGRMRAVGCVTEEIVRWAIQQCAKIDPEFERAYRGTSYLQESRTNPNGRLHELSLIDVNTETDEVLVNQAIRIDVAALDVAIIQAIATHLQLSSMGDWEPDWIPLIDWTLDFWRGSGYPRTSHITLESLHRLSICTGLLFYLGKMRYVNNTIQFSRLLAHGENLLLQAQQAARRTSEPDVEYVRLLDHPDDRLMPLQLHDFVDGDLRVKYITHLRVSTRGAGSDPLGPVPPSV